MFKGKTRFLTVAAALLVLAAGALPAAARPLGPDPAPARGRRYALRAVRDHRTGREVSAVADELVIRLRPEHRARRDEIVAGHRGRRLPHSDRLQTIRVKLAPGDDLETVLARYRADPAVEFAEPNYAAEISWLPDDPRYPEQWGLAMLGAAAAWDRTRGDPTVIVAILDTGLDLTHPDLAGQWLAGTDCVNDDADPSDDHRHGTLVSGVVAAAAGNGVGVAGLAPGCRLLPVKVIDASGCGTYADVVEGLLWAADHGARVISMSFGGYGQSQELQDAIDYAWRRGCVLVAAAGNDAISEPLYPAASAHVLGVASVNEQSAPSWFTNFGGYVDCAAPGERILTTTLGGGYGTASGTSLSTPFVSALAGLLATEYPDDEADSIAGRLLAGTRDLGTAGRDDVYGAGVVDAAAALAGGDVPTPPLPTTIVRAGDCLVTARPLTDAEFQQLKALDGVWQPGVTYGRVINGHGTGLKPPTEAQWQRLRGELLMTERVARAGAMVEAAPDSWDNTLEVWFPDAGNQGAENSCVSWAVGYYTKTFMEAKEHNWDLTAADTGPYVMSPEFLYHLVNGGTDNGSSYTDNIEVVRDVGICSWERMPYSAVDHYGWPSAPAWREAPLYRAANGITYLTVTSDTGLDSLRDLLSTGNLAIMRLNADYFDFLDTQELWTLDIYDTTSSNHGNAIVGYDNNFGPYRENGFDTWGAFKVINSWGKGWTGDTNADGCYWVSYGVMRQRMQSVMYFADSLGYQPHLVAVVTLDHAKRDEPYLSFCAGDTDPPLDQRSVIFDMGGGLAWPDTVPVTLDITELADQLPQNQSYLQVFDRTTTATNGNVTGFTIEYFATYDTAGAADTAWASANPPVSTTDGSTVTLALNMIDTKAVNAWYVNDGSEAGDSFTAAAGSATNDGLTTLTPAATASAFAHLLTPGDTVFIDAGSYLDKFTVETDAITVLGVDSATTILDYNDSSGGTAAVGIAADSVATLVIRNLGIRNTWYGVQWTNVDNSTIEDVAVSFAGQLGFYLTAGCEDNTLNRTAATGVDGSGYYLNAVARQTLTANRALDNVSGTGYGFNFNDADSNALTGNTAAGNSQAGFYLAATSDTNELQANTSTGNAGDGYYLFSGAKYNTLADNVSSGNQRGYALGNGSNFNLFLRNYSRDDTGFAVDASNDNLFSHNQADSCLNYAVAISGITAADTFQRNHFVPGTVNPDSGVLNATNSVFDFTRNWWGTADSTTIAARLKTTGSGSILYLPSRLGALDTAAAGDTVGPETLTAATDTALGQVRVFWSPPVFNDDGSAGGINVTEYRIYRAEVPSPADWGAAIGTTAAGDTEYIDTGVYADSTYYYAVTARDDAAWVNESYYSPVVSGVTTRGAGDFIGSAAIEVIDVAELIYRYRRPELYELRYDVGANGVDGLVNEEDVFEETRRLGQ